MRLLTATAAALETTLLFCPVAKLRDYVIRTQSHVIHR